MKISLILISGITFGISLAICTFARSTEKPIVPSAEALLAKAGLSTSYWHSDVTYAGTEDGVHHWIVGTFDNPEVRDERGCIANGVVRELGENEKGNKSVSVLRSDEEKLIYLFADNENKIDCAAYPFSVYMSVSGNISLELAASLIEEVNAASVCVADNESKCNGWLSITVPKGIIKGYFINLSSWKVISVFSQNQDYYVIRYIPKRGNHVYMKCEIHIMVDNLRTLKVGAGSIER